MWGKQPFYILDNCAVDVRNLAAAREWYKEKLGLHEANTDREEDSGRPFADLHISNDDAFLSLVELEPGASAEKRHVIFSARISSSRLDGHSASCQPLVCLIQIFGEEDNMHLVATRRGISYLLASVQP